MLFTWLYALVLFAIFFTILGVSCLVAGIALYGRAFVSGSILLNAAHYTSNLLDWMFARQPDRISRSYVALTRFVIWTDLMLDRHPTWEAAVNADWARQDLAEWERSLLADGPKHRADEPYDQERDA
jgi:hypothetical protein